jgi:hypothetical protein
MQSQRRAAKARESCSWRIAAGILAGAACLGNSGRAARAQVVFSDNFSSSTLNMASVPTGSSTSYDIASAVNANSISNISGGDLKLSQPASASAITEAQALFTNSPITLTNVGDYVKFRLTFTDTSNILTGNGSAAFYMGLFSSEGGMKPETDLGNGSSSGGTGLNSTGTADATGGVQNWEGFIAQIASSSSELLTRPAQSGPDNTNQDLLGITNLAATLSTDSNQQTTLMAGSQYAVDFTITLATAASVNGGHVQDQTYAMVTNLQALTGLGVTEVDSIHYVTIPSLYNYFDGLSFGFQTSEPPETDDVIPQFSQTTESTIDVSSLSISSNAIPEPASGAMISLATVVLMRRKSRHGRD